MRLGGISSGIILALMTSFAAAQSAATGSSRDPIAWVSYGVRTGASEPLQPAVYPSALAEYDAPASSSQTSASALADGAVLWRWTGQFGRSPDGQSWQFKPDPDPTAFNSIRPTLTVLPSSQLAALQTMAAEAGGSAHVTITGVLTSYNQRNYLLIELAWPAENPSTVLAADTAPAPQPATRPAAPLSPEQTLSQMLKPAAGGGTRMIRSTSMPSADATTGKSAVAPGAATLNVLREGTFLVDRTGRLTRGGDGQTWEFTFEADGRAMKDPPVMILPNLKLMAMEQATKSSNRDLRFRITGMVTEYNGRNYVLLEKVVVVPEVTQQF